MNTNDVYSELTCAATNDHIVREPIHLTCGHCICRACLPYEENARILCKITDCGQITDKDLRNEKESILIKRMIKMCLTGLLNEIETQTIKGINKFRGLSIKKKLIEIDRVFRVILN